MSVFERFKRWRKKRRLLKAYAMESMEAERAWMGGDWKYAQACTKRAKQIEEAYDRLCQEVEP